MYTLLHLIIFVVICNNISIDNPRNICKQTYNSQMLQEKYIMKYILIKMIQSYRRNKLIEVSLRLYNKNL